MKISSADVENRPWSNEAGRVDNRSDVKQKTGPACRTVVHSDGVLHFITPRTARLRQNSGRNESHTFRWHLQRTECMRWKKK
jgi:hypothetical protein